MSKARMATNIRDHRKPLSAIATAFATAVLCVVVVGAGSPAQAQKAAGPVVDIDDLKPTRNHKRAARLVTHYVGKYHYRPTSLDDELSALILERYLESLDPNRSYMTVDDVRLFSHYQHRLDDELEQARVDPAFEIFRRYRTRVAERSEFAIARLKREFDYELDEDYQFDRSEAEWAADSAELDDIWRKRVKNDILNLKLSGQNDDEIQKTLTRRYEQLQTRTEQLNGDDVFQLFLNAYATTIEPHTSYFSPRTSENFKIRMSLSLEGIGAVLQSENDHTLVRRIVPGGPADLSDELHAGDRIVGVGQAKENPVDVVGWRLDDVVDLIRGPKGSEVILRVLPKGAAPEEPAKDVVITRDKIKLEEQAAQKSILEIPAEDGGTAKIGVIKLPTFYIDFDAKARGDADYRSTTRDVRVLISELVEENVQSLVIDLRGNGGGSLAEATSLTGLFIRSGPIVQVRDSAGRVTVNQDPDPTIVYSGPLAVLVDRNSASASEIFAGAIQDYKRGLIVGERTYGKGTVQNLIDLDRQARSANELLGQLKITMAQFFRINGGSTQHRGVIPDIEFPTAINMEDHGERSLDNALPWTSVAPANYVEHKTNFDTRAMRMTRERHESRVSESPGFEFLVGRAEAAASVDQRKSISLLESNRREEREARVLEDRQRTNLYRESLGLKPLKEGEEPDEDEATAEDVILNEAAQILNDFSSLSDTEEKLADKPTASTGTADQQKNRL